MESLDPNHPHYHIVELRKDVAYIKENLITKHSSDSQRFDGLEKRTSSLERYKYYLMGGLATFTYILNKLT